MLTLGYEMEVIVIFDINKNLDGIYKLYNEGKIDLAIKLLKKLQRKELSPDLLYRVHTLYGVILFDKGDFQLSIQHYQKSLQILSDSNLQINKYEILYELSLAYFSLYSQNHSKFDLDKALSYCKFSLNDGIENSIVQKRTGLMIYYRKSSEVYIQALIHLALIYQAMEEYEKTIEILNISISCCKQHLLYKFLGLTYDELGLTYQLKGNISLAMYYYTKSIRAKEIVKNQKGIEVTMNKIFVCMISNPDILNSNECKKLLNNAKEESI